MFGSTFFSHALRSPYHSRSLRRSRRFRLVAGACLAALVCVTSAPLARVGMAQSISPAQSIERKFTVGASTEITIRNPRGRVQVVTPATDGAAATSDAASEVVVNAVTPAGGALAETDLVTTRDGNRLTIAVADGADGTSVNSSDAAGRVDLIVQAPARANVSIETTVGGVDAVGDFRRLAARTTTGTIRVDVPSANLRYDLEWTASRPRIYSLLDLAPVREGRGGRFSISGRFPAKKTARDAKAEAGATLDGNEAEDDGARSDSSGAKSDEQREADKKEEAEAKRRLRAQQVELALTTERGVVLIGADPATVPVDLRERALTEAARIFIRSGNETLIDRVRRLAPRLVDEYAGTLPNRRGSAPALVQRGQANRASAPGARVVATVTDRAGRPLKDLTKDDFVVTVGGVRQEVLNVTPADAPFNLVLLLDVSGSVEERLDFIRRAALRFAQTASPQDRIAIITFRDDVARVSDFTADRAELTRNINTIQAGGATALYDALGYVLLDTLRRVPEAEADRTAIVVLSDGDDNRSFLSFANVLDLTRETGTPFYPLYVPSGLIPTDNAASNANTLAASNELSATAADPTRARLMTLTSVATRDGARLAQETGGVFYPVARLEDLQRAYDDIVRQLRTSYTITYRAPRTPATNEPKPSANEAAEGLRIRVQRQNAVVARMGQPAEAK